jgi:hypothetical protein
LLIALLLCATAESQAGDPSTQNYKQAALRPGVSAESLGKPIQIQTSEASATIVAVRLITSDRQPHPGSRFVLTNASNAEDLFINANDATRLREEFASLAKWREADLECEAISICVQGVARCSPSQGRRQAICPSMYSTPQGERGVIIFTSDGTFRFPATQASTFAAALDASLEQMRDSH